MFNVCLYSFPILSRFSRFLSYILYRELIYLIYMDFDSFYRDPPRSLSQSTPDPRVDFWVSFLTFWWFLNFSVCITCFLSWRSNLEHLRLKVDDVRDFRRVSGPNEPPKVVISLRTSFKNRFYKHFASRTSSKPLLDHFWVVLSPPMRPKAGRQGGSTNHGFRLPQAFEPFQQSIRLQDPPPTPSQV